VKAIQNSKFRKLSIIFESSGTVFEGKGIGREPEK
jgi:hypothetical protein